MNEFAPRKGATDDPTGRDLWQNRPAGNLWRGCSSSSDPFSAGRLSFSQNAGRLIIAFVEACRVGFPDVTWSDLNHADQRDRAGDLDRQPDQSVRAVPDLDLPESRRTRLEGRGPRTLATGEESCAVAVAVAVRRRPDERAAAPRGARSHPADDDRRSCRDRGDRARGDRRGW